MSWAPWCSIREPASLARSSCSTSSTQNHSAILSANTVRQTLDRGDSAPIRTKFTDFAQQLRIFVLGQIQFRRPAKIPWIGVEWRNESPAVVQAIGPTARPTAPVRSLALPACRRRSVLGQSRQRATDKAGGEARIYGVEGRRHPEARRWVAAARRAGAAVSAPC